MAALSFPLEKRLSSKDATVVTIIAGDFNTDPTDPRFASEQTLTLLRERGFGMVHSFPTTMRKWRCNAVGHKAHGSVSSWVTIPCDDHSLSANQAILSAFWMPTVRVPKRPGLKLNFLSC